MPRLLLRAPLAIGLFSAAILVCACAELKSADGASGSGSGAEVAGSAPHPGSATGPGEHGSLPSGYCCNADSDCRDRHCATAPGGGRMCLDACRDDSSCQRKDVVFKCDAPTTHDDGFCQPPSASFACLPQASFARGSRQVGECCAPTGNGNSGEECDGNKCISIAIDGQDGPWVCSQRCASTKDCPSGTVCGPFGTCDPGNFPYTCL